MKFCEKGASKIQITPDKKEIKIDSLRLPARSVGAQPRYSSLGGHLHRHARDTFLYKLERVRRKACKCGAKKGILGQPVSALEAAFLTGLQNKARVCFLHGGRRPPTHYHGSLGWTQPQPFLYFKSGPRYSTI